MAFEKLSHISFDKEGIKAYHYRLDLSYTTNYQILSLSTDFSLNFNVFERLRFVLFTKPAADHFSLLEFTKLFF